MSTDNSQGAYASSGSRSFSPPRPESKPTIYAYADTNPQYAGLLKVGYTTVDVQARVAQQYPTKKPCNLPYRIVLEASAMRNGALDLGRSPYPR